MEHLRHCDLNHILAQASVLFALTVLNGCYDGVDAQADSDSGPAADCEGSFNGVSLNYPCAEPPASPTENPVLVSSYGHGNAVEDGYGFRVEVHETSLTNIAWAEAHLDDHIDGLTPIPAQVSGWPADLYESQGTRLFKSATTWYYLVRPESQPSTLYVVTLFASSADEALKSKYVDYTQTVLASLSLPGQS